MPKAPSGAQYTSRYLNLPQQHAGAINADQAKKKGKGGAAGTDSVVLDHQSDQKSYSQLADDTGHLAPRVGSQLRTSDKVGFGASGEIDDGLYTAQPEQFDSNSGRYSDRRTADPAFFGGTVMQAPLLVAHQHSSDPYSAYDQDSATFPNLNLTNQDLLNTATELYRRMEDPQFASDDAYWTSLPVHLRNFIRNALPLAGGVAGIGNGSGILPGGANAAGGQRAMYHLAQQVVNAANQGLGGMGQMQTQGGLAMHQTDATYVNGAPADSDHNGQGIANGGDEQYYGEESDNGSEDSVNNLAMDSLSISNIADGVDSGKKKKKKKKKGGPDSQADQRRDQFPPSSQPISAPPLAKFVNDHPPPPPSLQHTGIPAAQQQPPPMQAQYQQSLPQQNPQQHHQHAQPHPMQQQSQQRNTAHQPVAASKPAVAAAPATTVAAPPSSRAAGKQPMAYTQANPTPANTPAAQTNGTAPVRSARSAGKAPVTAAPGHAHPHNHAGHGHPPQAAAAKATPAAGGSKPKAAVPAQPPRIWQTSTSEEREKIKEFWLDLTQDDRQGLVKIEKDAVLKKMKEQQRHSCACAVCGRKRSAIEDELEVLYDAYYDELEAYAHHQAQYQSTAGAIAPPLGPGPFPGSVEMDNTGHIVRPDHLAPVARQDARRKTDGAETEDEEYDDDEDYDDDDLADDEEDAGSDEADNGDEDYEESQGRGNGNRKASTPAVRKAEKPVAKAADGADGNTSEGGDFFSFGSSLTTVKGILTVADDLLKNDGQKFMEMMEQLAERRMLREEAAINAMEDDMDEQEPEDDDVDGDLDEDEEDDEDDDEDDRMEEGRRMFQIFAARMFEQRVLQSYREKVAQQKQLQFLQELEEEENAAEAREARKAKEAQKKKDKKRMQKEAKDAEKAKKDADAAAAAAALKAKQEAAEKEAAKRREEERQRKEADKRARAEETQRKEEEKRKRAAEERDKEAELSRKKREKEEKLKAEKEAKERERKAQEEKDRLAKEVREKDEKEARERAVLEQVARKEVIRKEKEDREIREREALAAAQAQAQAKLLSQQKASAAKAAAIAQQQAKVQKSRAPVATLPPPVKAKAAKGAATSSTTVNGQSGAQAGVSASTLANVTPAVASATMSAANLLPTPNLKAAVARPSSSIPLAAAPAQAIPQLGFAPVIQPAPAGPSAPPVFAHRSSYAAPQSPAQFGSAPGQSQAPMQSPFPNQMSGFAAGRGTTVPASNAMFPMAFGTASIAGPVFSPALSTASASLPHSGGVPRTFTSELTEPSGRPSGITQLGIGHPGKIGRVDEDSPYSASANLATAPGGHGSIEFEASSPGTHVYQQTVRRPDPIGPIQPIGRPRIAAEDSPDDAGPSASNSRRSSPPAADRILGSAALGGDDDEVIVPAPRRVSTNNAAMGSSWGNPAPLANGTPSWGASAFSTASSGIWGGATPASAWPGSSSFGHASRYEPKTAPLSGSIGGFSSPQVGSRGFPSGSIGPPGGPVRPPLP